MQSQRYSHYLSVEKDKRLFDVVVVELVIYGIYGVNFFITVPDFDRATVPKDANVTNADISACLFISSSNCMIIYIHHYLQAFLVFLLFLFSLVKHQFNPY